MAPPPISGGAPVVTIGCTGCTTVVTSPEGFTVPKLEVSIGCSSAQSIDAVVPEQAVQVIFNEIDSWFCQLNQNLTTECLFDFRFVNVSCSMPGSLQI